MSKRELSPAVEVVPKPREPEDLLALRKARSALIDPRKWVKGAFHTTVETEVPGHCMLGALGFLAEYSCSTFMPGVSYLRDCVGDITAFNDALSTTHADVMAAFDLAIEQATKDWLAHRWPTISHGETW